ncbi:MAG: hypothetical protein ACOC5T_07525 [Elusimicrobiota bacterium]
MTKQTKEIKGEEWKLSNVLNIIQNKIDKYEGRADREEGEAAEEQRNIAIGLRKALLIIKREFDVEEHHTEMSEQQTRREDKKNIAYQFYKHYMYEKHSKPSLQRIADYLDCTRQNAKLIIDELRQEGKLVQIDFHSQQEKEIPADWLNSK